MQCNYVILSLTPIDFGFCCVLEKKKKQMNLNKNTNRFGKSNNENKLYINNYCKMY